MKGLFGRSTPSRALYSAQDQSWLYTVVVWDYRRLRPEIISLSGSQGYEAEAAASVEETFLSEGRLAAIIAVFGARNVGGEELEVECLWPLPADYAARVPAMRPLREMTVVGFWRSSGECFVQRVNAGEGFAGMLLSLARTASEIELQMACVFTGDAERMLLLRGEQRPRGGWSSRKAW